MLGISNRQYTRVAEHRQRSVKTSPADFRFVAGNSCQENRRNIKSSSNVTQQGECLYRATSSFPCVELSTDWSQMIIAALYICKSWGTTVLVSAPSARYPTVPMDNPAYRAQPF